MRELRTAGNQRLTRKRADLIPQWGNEDANRLIHATFFNTEDTKDTKD
jgi:hypothetical protein